MKTIGFRVHNIFRQTRINQPMRWDEMWTAWNMWMNYDELTMVYGRYNELVYELVNEDYFMVYKHN